MSVPIEINYLNPQKPRGLVGPRPQVRVNTPFRVFSNDGPLTFRFKGPAPFDQDPGVLPGNTDHTPTRVGQLFKFTCSIQTPTGRVDLDPDNPNAIGGEMEVIP